MFPNMTSGKSGILICGMPHPTLGFDPTSLKYQRLTLKRASLTMVGEIVRVHSNVPTVFRGEELTSRPGRPLFPQVSLKSLLVGTKYMLNATRSFFVTW